MMLIKETLEDFGKTLDHSVILAEKVCSLFVLAAPMAQNTCIINIQWSCNPCEIQGYKIPFYHLKL